VKSYRIYEYRNSDYHLGMEARKRAIEEAAANDRRTVVRWHEWEADLWAEALSNQVGKKWLEEVQRGGWPRMLNVLQAASLGMVLEDGVRREAG
jgi:hypothetical protein